MPVLDRRDGYRAAVDRAVTDFGATLGWSAAQVTKAKRISYRTIWAECDWLLLANPSVPESLLIVPNDGNGTDKNSTGLYQQRAQWWGSVLGSMDPYTSTTRFWQHTIKNTPDWFTTTESVVCQRTQNSQFDGRTINLKTGQPFPFGANYEARTAQVDALEADLNYFTRR